MSERESLLTSVEVVARNKSTLLPVRDVWLHIEEFIDGTERWSQMKATLFRSRVRPNAEAEALGKAMKVAAARGYLHIIKWLNLYFPTRRIRQFKISTDVMDIAATNGRLDVVQFLHSHRTEGCTVNAMDGAAGNGHLSVVKFLHKSRSEGCTINAMDCAAANDHLAVVKYLQASRTEGCSSRAFDGAARNENLKMLRFLRKHYHHLGGVTVDGAASAMHTRNLFLKWWLRWHYKDAMVFTTDSIVRTSH